MYNRCVFLSCHIFTVFICLVILDVTYLQCDYPAACNAMETLLIHKSHLTGGLFHKMIDDLKQNNVKVSQQIQMLMTLLLQLSF